MIRPHILHSALNWLLTGYPDGVPPKDYSPALALLRRQQLTEEEVGYIAARLVDDAVQRREGPDQVTREQVLDEIAAFTNEEPEEADVERVAALLGAAAWHAENGQGAPAR